MPNAKVSKDLEAVAGWLATMILLNKDTISFESLRNDLISFAQYHIELTVMQESV